MAATAHKTPAKKTPAGAGKRTAKKTDVKKSTKNITVKTFVWWKRPFVRLAARRRAFLDRRPHRSFLRTRRRDYVRSLQLPGYWSFTNSVRRMVWANKRVFVWVVVIYAIFTMALVGLGSQDVYTQLGEMLRSSSEDTASGAWSEIGKSSLLLVSAATGSLNVAPTAVQQVYGALLVLLAWLTTVWLLRAMMAGHKPRFRDGLYNGGSPLVATALVALVLIAQLIPMALAIIGYGAAAGSGLLDGGVEAMLFWFVAALLAVLSMYWVTSTLIALVVITLPGMYPMRAIKTAGDLVVGRRVRILLRLLWLGLSVVVLWLFVMVPLILIDTWVKGMLPIIEWVPVVPVALVVMGSLTVTWVASYIYLLYRKVVEDDSAPA